MTRCASVLTLAVMALATRQVACGGADDDTAADARPSDLPPERTETIDSGLE